MDHKRKCSVIWQITHFIVAIWHSRLIPSDKIIWRVLSDTNPGMENVKKSKLYSNCFYPFNQPNRAVYSADWKDDWWGKINRREYFALEIFTSVPIRENEQTPISASGVVRRLKSPGSGTMMRGRRPPFIVIRVALVAVGWACTMVLFKLNRFWFHSCPFNLCIVDLSSIDFVYWFPKNSFCHSDPLTRFHKK